MTNKKQNPEKVKHNNIYEALSAFHGDIPKIEKSKPVEYEGTSESGNKYKIKYSYAPLGEIREKIDPILAKHGLTAIHRKESVKGKPGINTYIYHETYERERNIIEDTENKEKISETGEKSTVTQKTETPEYNEKNVLSSGIFFITEDPTDPQDTAEKITYAKRYTLALVLGLSTEEDQDAQRGKKKKGGKRSSVEAIIGAIMKKRDIEEAEKIVERVEQSKAYNDQEKEKVKNALKALKRVRKAQEEKKEENSEKDQKTEPESDRESEKKEKDDQNTKESKEIKADDYTKEELKEMARQNHLSVRGTKADLVKRINRNTND